MSEIRDISIKIANKLKTQERYIKRILRVYDFQKDKLKAADDENMIYQETIKMLEDENQELREKVEKLEK